jgi:hypothetical protein
MESSVLFFVKVAAEAFIFENVIDIAVWLLSRLLFYLTSDTRLHIAHHVVKLVLINARRCEIGTPTADRLVRLGESTPELTCGANIHTPTT